MKVSMAWKSPATSSICCERFLFFSAGVSNVCYKKRKRKKERKKRKENKKGHYLHKKSRHDMIPPSSASVFTPLSIIHASSFTGWREHLAPADRDPEADSGAGAPWHWHSNTQHTHRCHGDSGSRDAISFAQNRQSCLYGLENRVK